MRRRLALPKDTCSGSECAGASRREHARCAVLKCARLNRPASSGRSTPWDGCTTMKLLATDIRGKTVMSDDGTMLGRLRNVTTNERTGDLAEVLVEPADDVDPRLFKRDARGYVVFPFENVKSVRDVIVVSTYQPGF